MRYFWLKLPEDFFDSLAIRKLNSLEYGAESVILYQKLLLKSLNTEGYIKFCGIEERVEDELALVMGYPVEIIEKTISHLEKMCLLKRSSGGGLQLLDFELMVGSETESARKMRRKRSRNAPVTNESQEGHNVTTEIREDIEEEEEKEEKKRRREEAHSSFSTQTLFTTKDIINYLNAKSGSSYSPDDEKFISLITQLLSQGFTLDDFHAVIDKKVTEWIGDPKSAAWLRPETLFGPKFLSYLNQPNPIIKNQSQKRTSTLNAFDLIPSMPKQGE